LTSQHVEPGIYIAADKVTSDKERYWWIQDRINDILKVTGHRDSNAKVESTLVSLPQGSRGRSHRPAR
jgi:acetyl-CoA synthetase